MTTAQKQILKATAPLRTPEASERLYIAYNVTTEEIDETVVDQTQVKNRLRNLYLKQKGLI